MSETTRALVDAPNYATIVTLGRDGHPQTSVMWITRDGDDLLFSTVGSRQKAVNLRRDPRASVNVWDSANPESYVEIRGTVSVTPDEGRTLLNALALKYTGKAYPTEAPEVERVVLRLTPQRVAGNAK
ncbi:PPOX class F420-dependent oxidoreductase [Saccharothrix violaceirubra]